MDTKLASRSDAIKEEVLCALHRLGGRIEADSYSDLRTKLGLDHIAIRIIRRALWKLVVRDQSLVFWTEKDLNWHPHSGEPHVEAYCYKVV